MSNSVAMIKKQIAGYILMPEDAEVLETCLAGIYRAIDRLNTRNWNSSLTYDDIPFSTTATDYPLISWFRAPRNFEIWDASDRSVGRLQYKQWKSFLIEHPDVTAEGDPSVYSCANFSTFGTVTLNATPSEDWVSKYPNGRIWYYRRWQYPSGPATELDPPSEFTAFIQSWAEGYAADRHAPTKAAPAYARAREQLHELIVDDCHGQTTDWE